MGCSVLLGLDSPSALKSSWLKKIKFDQTKVTKVKDHPRKRPKVAKVKDHPRPKTKGTKIEDHPRKRPKKQVKDQPRPKLKKSKTTQDQKLQKSKTKFTKVHLLPGFSSLGQPANRAAAAN